MNVLHWKSKSGATFLNVLYAYAKDLKNDVHGSTLTHLMCLGQSYNGRFIVYISLTNDFPAAIVSLIYKVRFGLYIYGKHIARDRFVPCKSVFTKNFPLVQSVYLSTDPVINLSFLLYVYKLF